MKPILLLTLIAILFMGCGTIISGTRYPLSIRTEPKGASVIVTDRKGREIYKGVTPAKLKVKSGAGYFTKAQYTVKLNAPGYAEKIVTVNFKFNGWYIGNLFIGGGIGLIIVDPLTGGMWKIADPVVDEKLEPAKETTLKIVNINDVTEEQRKVLVKID